MLKKQPFRGNGLSFNESDSLSANLKLFYIKQLF